MGVKIPSRIVAYTATAAIGLAVVVLGWLTWSKPETATHVGHKGPTPAGTITPTVKVGGPFALVDHDGKAVTDADYRGRYLLVYFGYTNCPDMCPITAQKMASALDALGEQAKTIQPLLITVDPERDTPKVLAEYVKAFHPRMIGLTGTPDQVATVAKAYRVYYAKGSDSKAAKDYLMDHSSAVYLIGPDGKFLIGFSHQASPEQMADVIRSYLQPSG
ncbi:MAG: SCO family protein [Rhodospirillales bacterium]|nr:SCO family protein [Rhodospirillales bacterium]